MTLRQPRNQIPENEESPNAIGIDTGESIDRLTNYYLGLYPDLTGQIIQEIQQTKFH